jgi:hypothetical protein
MSCRGALRRVGGADLGRRAAQKMMKEQALNATILSSSAYSVVEKVILLKSCKVFESATDQALAEVAELVKMIRLPPGVLLYKEGAPGYDSFVIASGQVKLTKNGRLIGAWPADDAMRRPCVVGCRRAWMRSAIAPVHTSAPLVIGSPCLGVCTHCDPIM